MSYALAVGDVFAAIEANNRNVGGGYIARGSEQYLIRGEGLVETLEDLKSVVLAHDEKGTPVYLRAGVATVLAAVGIYSFVAYTVAQRTREIGIRQALGARRSDVFRMVVANGMTVALAGGAVGLLGAWWATRGLQSLLYDVTVRDPLIFLAVSLLLGLVALLANALPAWRAARIQPAQALHYG